MTKATSNLHRPFEGLELSVRSEMGGATPMSSKTIRVEVNALLLEKLRAAKTEILKLRRSMAREKRRGDEAQADVKRWWTVDEARLTREACANREVGRQKEFVRRLVSVLEARQCCSRSSRCGACVRDHELMNEAYPPYEGEKPA